MQTVVSCEKPVFEDKALQKDWEWYKANFAELKRNITAGLQLKIRPLFAQVTLG